MTAQGVTSTETSRSRYAARRRNEVRAVLHHSLGTLFVIGALVLIVNF
jgi:hypothetical protein